jgi:Ni/Fe-hydrogenase subunit HybB-like protein
MKPTLFTQLDGGRTWWYLLGGLGLVILLALAGVYHMEHNGHWVTGMDNHIVWGMPHVFAIFLIVAASGALNIASIGTVFGKKIYKPLAPLSGLLAIALLIGGLIVLVLDLGRPDRLIVAMTTYNFKSIFTWNILLYNGFILIVAAYLWMMMEKRMNCYAKPVGYLAFIWRLILTTGTGSIFGFLVAREAYDAAILAPMFVIYSFAYGLAVFILVMVGLYEMDKREIGDKILMRMRNLLGVFIAAAFYFVLVYHLTNLYATQHHGFESFILLDGGAYTAIFWLGQILIGLIVPFALIYLPATRNSRSMLLLASLLVILGGFAQLYVTLIAAQAYPLNIFPGYEVTSSFSDGITHGYSPTLSEFLLGFGGISLALLLVAIGTKVLRFLPDSLSDAKMDPHSK